MLKLWEQEGEGHFKMLVVVETEVASRSLSRTQTKLKGLIAGITIEKPEIKRHSTKKWTLGGNTHRADGGNKVVSYLPLINLRA